MAGIFIENSGYLRQMLRLLGADHWACNWLVTELECYDDCGWDGCEKWASATLFLSNRALLRDVEFRDMQFVWGILSAIPAGISRRQVLEGPLPSFQDETGAWRPRPDSLQPQHPLAFLEIQSEDSSSVTVIARDEALLRPLWRLPEWMEDAEAYNRRGRQMEEVKDRLVRELGYGAMSPSLQRNLSFHLWQTLYHHQPEKEVHPDEVEALYWTYFSRKQEEEHG